MRQEAAPVRGLSTKLQDPVTAVIKEHSGDFYEKIHMDYRPHWRPQVWELLITLELGN